MGLEQRGKEKLLQFVPFRNEVLRQKKKRRDGELPGCSIFKKQPLNLIGTEVLTADSHGIAKCQPVTAS